MKLFATSLFAVAAAAADNFAATPAPHLLGRAADPSVIGFFSASNGGYSDGRSCDFPATVSTNGNYAKCCTSGKPCDFFTSCSGNTLIGSSATAACDNGVCNTAVLLQSAGANGGKSNLACWQASLGSSAFTLVQDIGSATVVAASTTGGSSSARSTGPSSASSGTSSGASSSGSQASSTGASAGAASSSPSPTKNVAAGLNTNQATGGLIAAAMAFIQALL